MSKPLDIQIGGNHYKDMAIQPIEYTMKNNLNFCQGNIVKYISRYKSKNGIEDLKKAKHYIDLLIAHEEGINKVSQQVQGIESCFDIKDNDSKIWYATKIGVESLLKGHKPVDGFHSYSNAIYTTKFLIVRFTGENNGTSI